MKLRPIGKKADLSLSINAIVILILAITVLSLGLTFIRSMFKSAGSKIEGAISLAELDSQPTIEKPITIPETVEIPSTGSTTIKIGIFNLDPSAEFSSAKPILSECILAGSATDDTTATDETETTGSAGPFTLTTTTQTIAKRSSAAYKAILQTSASGGTYVCTVKASGSGIDASLQSSISGQFFINVK
ncbi:hypothetical protein JXB27_02230 [Candidatus Woesearchaeota archaeon]|nr:hypothetical protein [Candidatus Woesearchaeota archaeon]